MIKIGSGTVLWEILNTVTHEISFNSNASAWRQSLFLGKPKAPFNRDFIYVFSPRHTQMFWIIQKKFIYLKK